MYIKKENGIVVKCEFCDSESTTPKGTERYADYLALDEDFGLTMFQQPLEKNMVLHLCKKCNTEENSEKIKDKYNLNIPEVKARKLLHKFGSKEATNKCLFEIINCDSYFRALEDARVFVKYWNEVQEELNKLPE